MLISFIEKEDKIMTERSWNEVVIELVNSMQYGEPEYNDKIVNEAMWLMTVHNSEY